MKERSTISVLWENYSELYWTNCIVLLMIHFFLLKVAVSENLMHYINYFYLTVLSAVFIKCTIKQLTGFGRKNVIIVKWYYVLVGLISLLLQAILMLTSVILSVRVLMVSIGIL